MSISSATRTPRCGSATRSRSDSRTRSASRTGVMLTPKSAASSSCRSRRPRGYSPDSTRRRIACAIASLLVLPATVPHYRGRPAAQVGETRTTQSSMLGRADRLVAWRRVRTRHRRRRSALRPASGRPRCRHDVDSSSSLSTGREPAPGSSRRAAPDRSPVRGKQTHGREVRDQLVPIRAAYGRIGRSRLAWTDNAAGAGTRSDQPRPRSSSALRPSWAEPGRAAASCHVASPHMMPGPASSARRNAHKP